MIFKHASVLYWQYVTPRKHQQAGIDNVHENTKQVIFYYAKVCLLYLDKTGIYQKQYHNKYVTYRIAQVFTNITFWV